MLNKLLKYDLENKFKLLTVFYCLSLFFAVLTRIFLSIPDSFIMDIIGKVCSGVTISMIFNILINCLTKAWVRFKSNFYGDESYLTHTLPVDKKTLYLSKFLSSLITLFLSFVVIALTLFVAYYSKENIIMIKNMLLPLATVYESTVLIIVLSIIFVFVLEIMNILQSGCVGIVLGHRKNNNKILYSLLFAFCTYLFTQMLAVGVIFIVALFNKDLMNLFYTVETLNVDVIKLCIYLAIAIYTLNIIILYFVGLKMFNKGVNVD